MPFPHRENIIYRYLRHRLANPIFTVHGLFDEYGIDGCARLQWISRAASFRHETIANTRQGSPEYQMRIQWKKSAHRDSLYKLHHLSGSVRGQ